ncbi:HK97 family phage prohead protease [Heyndrickxia oleronia]|uniref:HK97 family phage prohead protease n=1 Tax=Heyndrickxia oleronia TaxID=38875 RepID=A0AAW6SVV8_9BACI|nr:HK97 family phage prohead protease [Heyndrickxia oleronia]MDH5161505.1 HK97 family phage prohead protease [Heyndrickxia oleronia]
MEKRLMVFASDLKTRDEENGEAFIEGYFAVFNQETELWPGAFEEIAPGAFDKSLKENDIMCLDNHDTRAVLGSTGSQTLELKTDSHGLWGRVKVDLEDPFAKSAYRKVQTGKVRGCSFGFIPLKEETEYREDGTVKWVVTEADTHEVSITAFPAYSQTEVAARKKDVAAIKKEKLEQRKAKLKERLNNA